MVFCITTQAGEPHRRAPTAHGRCYLFVVIDSFPRGQPNYIVASSVNYTSSGQQMSYRGRPSKGCEPCRARKVKVSCSQPHILLFAGGLLAYLVLQVINTFGG